MTDAERAKVIEAMQPLDQFVSDGASGMNTSRGFHFRWQQAWEHVQAKIAELAPKPDKPKKR